MVPKKSAKQSEKEALVIFADSESDTDLLYATSFHAGDPFLFFQIGWRRYLLASDLELGRATKTARVHHVLPVSRYRKRLEREGAKKKDLVAVLVAALAERGVTTVRVPQTFPVFAADRLRRAGIRVRPVPAPFWPERAKKSEREVDAIREAVRATEEGIRAGIELIRESRPRHGILRSGGEPLTSERVRGAIETRLLELGASPRHTIVAGGEQACDPHDTGSGPLRAGWPVILDVFPRMTATGYHGDITRTVVRGKPSRERVALFDAVRDAQAEAVDRIRAGVNGRDVHEGVKSVFEERGYRTGSREDGGMEGFFHGTGHGLGLAVHEPPRVGGVDETLEEGMVVTVEPGLYYPGIGGVRIEDDVVVREDGAENLVELEKVFEL